MFDDFVNDFKPISIETLKVNSDDKIHAMSFFELDFLCLYGIHAKRLILCFTWQKQKNCLPYQHVLPHTNPQ